MFYVWDEAGRRAERQRATRVPVQECGGALYARSLGPRGSQETKLPTSEPIRQALNNGGGEEIMGKE